MNISSLMGGSGGMPNISAMRDKMFQKADLNGDKGISLEEFQSAGKKMPIGKDGDGTRAAEVFGKIDKDGNGSLSKDELSALGDKMSSKMQSMMLTLQEMTGGGGRDRTAIFEKADRDQSGGLSRGEYDEAGRNNPLAKLLGSDQRNNAFGKIDADGDGSLSRTEFDAFAEKQQGRMQSLMAGDRGMDKLLHGMNAYGKSVTGHAASDMMSSLLDMLDGGTATEKNARSVKA